MDRLLFDLRHGARMLRRAPGVAALAAVALALGIGSTTTMFSITSGILRDLPVEAPERLMHVAATDRRWGDEYLRIPVSDIAALREQQQSFEVLAAYEDQPFHIGDADRRAERLHGALVTASLFRALRVRPTLGRPLAEADERPGATPVVVLGYAVWRDRYASDSSLLGKVVRLNGVPTTVIGIMPEGFGFPAQEVAWAPLVLHPTAVAGMPLDRMPAFTVIGRLRDGTTTDAAGADVAAIGRRLTLADPGAHEGRSLAVRPFRDEMIPRDARIIFRAMLLVVSFVLVIACANVANLLLARTVSRSREMAVRVALGAAPRRLMRQMLAESLAVAIPGGALGLLLAWGGVTVFNAMVGFELSWWMRVTLDTAALVFSSLLIVLAGAMAGLAPARQVTRVSVGEVLKDASRGSSSFRLGRLSRALVVGEVALSCALLVVTGLMVKGVASVTSRYGGVAPEQVATARFELRDDAYPDAAARARFYETLERRLAAHPGAVNAALATQLPGLGAMTARVEIEGVRYHDRDAIPMSRVAGISPGLMRTVGVRLLRGREFTWADRETSQRVAIVNRAFAELHFRTSEAIGRRVRVLDAEGGGEWATIVGIAPELGMSGVDSRATDGVYVPLAQTGERFVAVAVRATGDPARLVEVVRSTLASLDPDVPVFSEGVLDRQLAGASTSERFFGGLFTFFGLSALILAVVGLVGVLTFSVTRRTRELGIRMALGGRASRILWLVLRGGLIQLGLGLTLGLAIAAALAPQFGDALFGQDAHDWTVYLFTATALLVAGLLAALYPARRALGVQPVEALRSD